MCFFGFGLELGVTRLVVAVVHLSYFRVHVLGLHCLNVVWLRKFASSSAMVHSGYLLYLFVSSVSRFFHGLQCAGFGFETFLD